MIFRIVRSILQDRNAKPLELADVKKRGIHRVKGVYYAGDIIETDVDLNRFNNGSVKFTQLRNYIKKDSSPNSAVFSGMTIAELRAYAEGEEIDIDPTFTKKAEIINAIELAEAEVGIV